MKKYTFDELLALYYKFDETKENIVIGMNESSISITLFNIIEKIYKSLSFSINGWLAHDLNCLAKVEAILTDEEKNRIIRFILPDHIDSFAEKSNLAMDANDQRLWFYITMPSHLRCIMYILVLQDREPQSE